MLKNNLVVLILMSTSLLINCGGNTPKKPDPKTFNVTCSSFVTITNPSAIEGQNYSTNLIAEEGIILPEVVKRVMINDQISTNYNYALESGSTSKATFSIASQYVIGSINIELELIHGYKVTCTEGVKVSNPIAVSNQLYATKLNVAEGFILPSEPISVKINGTEFARDKFYYQLMPESVNEALFTIDKENLIPGPIDIELDMHYVVTANEGIAVSRNIAVLGQDYETNLSVLEDFSFHNAPTRVTINGIETSNYSYLKEEENKVRFFC